MSIQRPVPFRKHPFRKYYLLLLLLIFLLFNLITSNSFVKPTGTSSYRVNYDLARALGIPSYVNATFEHQTNLSISPHSILATYDMLAYECPRRPYIPRLRTALEEFATHSRSKAQLRLEHFVSSAEVLVVQFTSSAIQPNGTSLSNVFIQHLQTIARNFEKALLIPTQCTPDDIPCILQPASLNSDLNFVKKSINAVGLNTLTHRPINTDHTLYLMHKAANLFVHRGAFSALAALSSTGTLYYTPELSDYMENNQFKWFINNPQPVPPPPPSSINTHYLSKLNMMGQVQPSCCKFDTFGVGDGAKVVCTNTKRFLHTPCWILSVGCNGKWSFERSIFSETSCHVHTFDCTGDWQVPKEIAERVTLHKLCLGIDGHEREDYKTWKELISIGSSQTGMKETVVPALAKMDIEGAEFPVLDSLLNEKNDDFLPEQLAAEIHVHVPWPESPPFDLFNRLRQRGYALVHRADNPYCIKCSEITLVHESGLPNSN